MNKVRCERTLPTDYFITGIFENSPLRSDAQNVHRRDINVKILPILQIDRRANFLSNR